jgi:hypothetical protein
MGSEEPRARTSVHCSQVRSDVSMGGAHARGSGTDISTADIELGLREACHDMRQPVAGVLALAGAALAEPGLPEAVRVRLEEIVQHAEWLADMIQDWLHDARLSGTGAQADLRGENSDLAMERDVLRRSVALWMKDAMGQ